MSIETVARRSLYRQAHARGGDLRSLANRKLLRRIWRFSGRHLSETDVRGGDEVLHGISFTAQPGEMVALVGSSGAGKSTIASLMARLYDVGAADEATSNRGPGSIKFSGVDVRDVTFASLKDTVGMVTQDGHLFHESIGSNLRLVAPDATDEELWQALERARLADAVGDMSDGLDTVVGERGYRLSGGQRQRLTIARLLLGRHDSRRRGRSDHRTRHPRPAAGPRRAVHRAVRHPVRRPNRPRRCRSGVRAWKRPLLICRSADNWNYFD